MTSSICSATFRLRPARSGLVMALLFATAGAAWGADTANAAQPVKARIDASKTRAPISKYVYGQFIEHIAGIINTGLWAEMLDDRKFLQPIAVPPSPAPPPRGRPGALRRWSPVGPADAITMDADRPYVGDHSPVVKLNGAEPRGIRQAGFTFATSLVSADRSSAVLNPAGLLFQLYRDHFGTIPVEVTGDSPQPPPKYPAGGEEPRVNAGSDTFPLDVVAAWTADHRTLTVAVINPTESEQRLELAIAGATLAGTGRLWRMAPADLNATIVVGQKPGVTVEEQALDVVPGAPSFAPFSVNVYAFAVK